MRLEIDFRYSSVTLKVISSHSKCKMFLLRTTSYLLPRFPGGDYVCQFSFDVDRSNPSYYRTLQNRCSSFFRHLSKLSVNLPSFYLEILTKILIYGSYRGLVIFSFQWYYTFISLVYFLVRNNHMYRLGDLSFLRGCVRLSPLLKIQSTGFSVLIFKLYSFRIYRSVLRLHGVVFGVISKC